MFFPFRFKNGGLKHIFLPFGPKKFLYASVIGVSTYILSEDPLPNTEVKPGGFYRFDGTLRSEVPSTHRQHQHHCTMWLPHRLTGKRGQNIHVIKSEPALIALAKTFSSEETTGGRKSLAGKGRRAADFCVYHTCLVYMHLPLQGQDEMAAKRGGEITGGKTNLRRQVSCGPARKPNLKNVKSFILESLSSWKGGGVR